MSPLWTSILVIASGIAWEMVTYDIGDRESEKDGSSDKGIEQEIEYGRA